VKGVSGLLAKMGAEGADAVSSLVDAIELLMSSGASADLLASTIWGEGNTWESVSASYKRDPLELLAIWEVAGFQFEHTVGGCTAVAIKLNGVRFLITYTGSGEIPNPDFVCLVGAYDQETGEYLDVMEEV
jgi:hypothetical protein